MRKSAVAVLFVIGTLGLWGGLRPSSLSADDSVAAKDQESQRERSREGDRPSRGNIFDRLDKDGDGSLSREEFEAGRAARQGHDRGESSQGQRGCNRCRGSRDHGHHGHGHHGHHRRSHSDRDRDRDSDDDDSDRDGRRHHNRSSTETIERIFDHIDANDDGEVTKEEAAAAHERFHQRHRQREGDSRREARERYQASAERMEQIFDRIDADEDGAVTKEEVASARRRMHEQYRERYEERRSEREERDRDSDDDDSDRDNRRHHHRSSGETIERIFDHMDANDDGEVTKEEAAAAHERYHRRHAQREGDSRREARERYQASAERMERMFDRIDANEDGTVTKEEVASARRRMHEQYRERLEERRSEREEREED